VAQPSNGASASQVVNFPFMPSAAVDQLSNCQDVLLVACFALHPPPSSPICQRCAMTFPHAFNSGSTPNG
jgi:hypothetical protein